MTFYVRVKHWIFIDFDWLKYVDVCFANLILC